MKNGSTDPQNQNVVADEDLQNSQSFKSSISHEANVFFFFTQADQADNNASFCEHTSSFCVYTKIAEG